MTIYIIKNDNSLWARGNNIYCENELYTNTQEFSKIDDNVKDVFCSDKYNNEYIFYTKTNNSLWVIGNFTKKLY